MDIRGIKDIQDVRASPGVRIDTRDDNIGDPRHSSTGRRHHGIYIDDTPIQSVRWPSTGRTLPKSFDMDRIEVLRGPQARCSAPDRRAVRCAISPSAEPHQDQLL